MSWGSIHQFVRMPIEGSEPELDEGVAGQVLRLNLAAFFMPEAQQGGLVITYDDPGIGTADEAAPAR